MKVFTVVLLGAVFVFMVWAFDIRGALTLWQQHQAETFPITQGQVLSSRMRVTHGSKGGIHYHISIIYSYVVNGLTHQSVCYRYDGHPGNAAAVNALVAQHPAGSTIDVYYNPQDPGDSVLSTGVDAQDVYNLFLFTPFCLLFFWVLVNAVQEVNWGGTPVAGGVKLISEMMVTRVRLPRFQPLMPGLAALGGFSLVAFLLMASGILSGPPLATGAWLLLSALLGGAIAYGWQYQHVHSGRQDLVIDESSRTIQLPLTYKRRTQTPVPFSEIMAVALKKVAHQRKGGVRYTYLVTLKMKDGSSQNLINLNQARAEALAAWLNEKFGLTSTTPFLDSDS